jgi:glycosidase
MKARTPFFRFLGGFLVSVVLLLRVEAKSYFPSPSDWRDLTLYMIFTDRFADGDSRNNAATPGAVVDYQNPRGIHGGDFRGIETHLDYIANMGARAIWITPVFLNEASTAWHGYGAIDLRQVSPQLGGLDGLRHLIRSAHRRGIYVIIDVVVNHLGGVVVSSEPGWPHFRVDGPSYQLQWNPSVPRPAPPFDRLDWFHNRGQVEDWMDPVQSVIGQFYTLADLRTELPEVRSSLIAAFHELIRTTDCDGFRVDTVRHVEPSFWPLWCSAIRSGAAALGKTNFLLFGEVALPVDAALAPFTGPSGSRERAFDSLLDFPLERAILDTVCFDAPTHRLTERFVHLASPPYSAEAVGHMVTFIDNHDGPRFLSAEKANGDNRRLIQALALLYTSPGIPCLYYGTEQGFKGGNDPFNREDMIPRTASATNHFDTHHPLYSLVRTLNHARVEHPSLRCGDWTVLLDNPAGPGLFVARRRSGDDSAIIILNTSAQQIPIPAMPADRLPGTTFRNVLVPTPSPLVLADGFLPAHSLSGHGAEIWVSTPARR